MKLSRKGETARWRGEEKRRQSEAGKRQGGNAKRRREGREEKRTKEGGGGGGGAWRRRRKRRVQPRCYGEVELVDVVVVVVADGALHLGRRGDGRRDEGGKYGQEETCVRWRAEK